MTLQALAGVNGLRLGPDGIWYGSGTSELSYPAEGNDACFPIEDDSFWFKHRNDCIVSVVRRFPPADGECIFDVGGGNGFVAKGMADAGFDVAVLEPGAQGAANARRRGLENVACATLHSAGFEPRSLAAVGLFDVVEHIDDDLMFLRSVADLMKDGGRLYLSVPAHAWLWSAEDVSAGHHRRYNRATIGAVLAAAGFDVKFSSYFFRFLPLPIYLFRALPHRWGWRSDADTPRDTAADHQLGPGLLRRLIEPMLKAECKRMARGQLIGFGASCLVVATPSRQPQM